MRGTITVQCPGCNTKEVVRAKSPGFLSPVSVTFQCEVCESQVTAKMSQHPDPAKRKLGSIKMDIGVQASQKLRDAVNESAMEASENE